MLREDKHNFVGQMRDDVQRAAGVLFLDYTGLTVDEANQLRVKLRAAHLTYRVVKNSLMARAIEGSEFADASRCLKGTPTGVVLGFEDPVSTARTAFEFIKTCDHLKVKGGVLENKAISAQQAEALSKMPSKGELQASVVAQALSPGRKLLSQLKNPAGRIVGAIDKLIKNKEAQ